MIISAQVCSRHIGKWVRMCRKGSLCGAWNLLIPIGASRLPRPCEKHNLLSPQSYAMVSTWSPRPGRIWFRNRRVMGSIRANQENCSRTLADLSFLIRY